MQQVTYVPRYIFFIIKMQFITRLFLATLMTSASLVAHAQLYKCKQANGSTTFQDVECPQAASSTKLHAPQTVLPEIMKLSPNASGHYYTGLTINGVRVEGMLDTGATMVTISAATAQAMQIPLEGSATGRVQTANGSITTLFKVLPIVKVGSLELYSVEICITENSPTLIGMSALSHLKMSQENGQLILSKK